jgi:hypothetical protein
VTPRTSTPVVNHDQTLHAVVYRRYHNARLSATSSVRLECQALKAISGSFSAPSAGADTSPSVGGAGAGSNAPGLLGGVALACFVAAPALVFVCPDSSSQLVALQAVLAASLAAGGAAALGGSTLLASLQK